jgi:hypothetical protein
MEVKSIITLGLGANVIKLFTGVSNGFSYQARVFVAGKPFQPSLVFVGKARSLPYRGASERLINRVGSCFTNKH